MRNFRTSMLVAAVVLAAGWLVAHADRVMSDDEAFAQIVLALIYCVVVVWRREPSARACAEPSAMRLMTIGVGGVLLGLVGIVIPVRQFEWLGLLMILFACLRAGLPPRLGANLLWGLPILYFGHPLPGQLLGAFHMAMQRVSVAGSEWFLHALNARIWADGLILRDGFRSFGVPEACSGLRTAYTVLLCAAGLGMALRRRWYEIIVFMVIGLVQVLAMNILRISGMVFYAPKMPPEWADNFLHDSLGVFLLLTIVLIHLEVSLWHSWRARRARLAEGVRSGELDAPDKATVLPGAWRLGKKVAKPAVALLLLIVVMSAFAFKRRASHRVAMISDVVDGLMTSDPALACRAIDDALLLSPDDRGLRSQKARAYALSGRLEEALSLQESLGELDLNERVVKSSVLMMLGRLDEAIAMLDSLPPVSQRLPGVAMLRAEYAAHTDDPQGVATHLAEVGQHRVYLHRVRALFPYLASHRQWKTVSDLDAPVPYRDIDRLLIAVTAQLRVGRYSDVARLLKDARKRWPEDIRLVGPTFLLAVQRPGARWERHLERDLYRHLESFDADTLATYLGYCFRMGRADLAWLLYARLSILDPKDPALHLSVATHFNTWFGFRHHQLGLPSDNSRSVVDVRPLCRLTKSMVLMESFWGHIPFSDDLTISGDGKYRERHVRAAIEELRVREAEGALGYRLSLNFARALVMAEEYDEALARYAVVRERFPEWEAFALQQSAVIHTRQKQWHEAYEFLYRYSELTSASNLNAGLLTINCLMNVNLGVYALDVAQRLVVDFPQAEEVTRIVAAIWGVFGSKEQALFLLGSDVSPINSRVIVQLLHDTGRYSAARQMASVLGTEIRGAENRYDLPFLPPAERTLQGNWPEPASDAQKKTHAEEIRNTFGDSPSPFIKGLREAEASWYDSGGSAKASAIEAWAAIGRNARERGAALHVLTMLLAQDGRREDAFAACHAALEHLPVSAPLWRSYIALAEETAKHKAVLAARSACPSDPGIWLAYLVSRYEEEGAGPWMSQEARAVTESRLFSVGAMVRAGSFFRREGHPDEAAIYARQAIDRSQGLISAYVLGVQCAAALKDTQWALDCVVSAIPHAQDPAPFYHLLLNVKVEQDTLDNDVVEALDYMKERFPDQHDWADALGRAYFQQGDSERALVVFSSLMEETKGKLRLRSLLMASEVARMEGNQAQALRILETAYAVHSQSMSVLNNLVYNLSQSPNTVNRAKRLLPRLLEMNQESYAVLDTAALVHLRSGDVGKADLYMRRALAVMPEQAYGIPEARLNAAEISLRLGRHDDARTFAQETIADPKATPADTVRARRLLLRLDRSR